MARFTRPIHPSIQFINQFVNSTNRQFSTQYAGPPPTKTSGPPPPLPHRAPLAGRPTPIPPESQAAMTTAINASSSKNAARVFRFIASLSASERVLLQRDRRAARIEHDRQ